MADPRFSPIDWLSIYTLAGIVNQRSGTPVIRSDLNSAAPHPAWIGNLASQMDRATEESPREPGKLLAVIEQWRQRIRATAPTWGQPGPAWNPTVN